MSKYNPDTSHWDDNEDAPPEWVERTSATLDLEVTLHDEGYQTDRRWTVHIRQRDGETPTVGYAAEHQNKGNFWREPEIWRDAVDFAELPRPARKRVASLLNRSVDEITPEERTIHREDGTGIGDRAAEDDGACDVCGGKVYDAPESGPVRHPDCEVVNDAE